MIFNLIDILFYRMIINWYWCFDSFFTAYRIRLIFNLDARSQARKMYELDRDNAKNIDDDETDDIEEIQDEIGQEVQVAEPTDRSSL